MIGAIAGDLIGSVYEQHPIKTTDFPLFQPRSRFTDDSVLTVAIADALLTGQPYQEAVRDWGRRYPQAGYGGAFFQWLFAADPRPYHSWGNGSAMRVSPVGWAFASEDEVLRQARLSAEITHDHPEGIQGAQATALAVYLARTGAEKATIRSHIQSQFGYDLAGTVETLRPGYAFDVSCQGTVPAALIAFLDAESHEDTVRNARLAGRRQRHPGLYRRQHRRSVLWRRARSDPGGSPRAPDPRLVGGGRGVRTPLPGRGGSMLNKIVSGGQTSVDRAALDVGLALGLAVGGGCPPGRRAEDGVIPARDPLVETPERNYQARTRRNIEDSDGTLILNLGALDGGTALTARHARQIGQPCRGVALEEGIEPAAFWEWLAAHHIAMLNVAGPRESKRPRVYAAAERCLEVLLQVAI
jgi:hypothetical protein